MVVEAGSRAAIQAPPATPPLYSLLQVADTTDDGERWQLGTIWSPEQVGGGGSLPAFCAGDNPDGKPLGTNPQRNTADPFTVYAEDHCSMLGFEGRDYEGRARRQLAAVQSARIAREFQLGEIRDAQSLNNVALVDAITVGPGNQDVDLAIGVLEAALADKFQGGRAMIHVTVQTLTEMARRNLIYQSGQKWLTAPGNVVVSDAGYTAEANGIYAYGTAMVKVRLSPVDVIPGSWDDARARAQAVNRATNDVTIYAERMTLVEVDHTDVNPADLVFKVELDLPPWQLGS